MSNKVLVVEDQKDLAALLGHNLRMEGLDVREVHDGNDALSSLATWAPDLIILDLMLPGIDGFEVLRSARAHTPDVAVLVLTARGEEQDKIRSFRLDADQYVTKPFSLPELLERVQALLRRKLAAARVSTDDARITFGTVAIDVPARIVRVRGTPVALSPKAFDLLLALIRRRGRVASRIELLREVWGYGPLVLSRTVDSHIVELRRKLEADHTNPRHILTVYKSGYRFDL